MKLIDVFSKKLRKLREKKGLTREELAVKTKLSFSMISQIERAENNPSFDTIETLAKALRCEGTEFFRK